jgi:chromosome segregation ATPase
VKNQTLTPPPQETPKTKARKKETTAAGKMGDWQRLLAPLAANADELQHLEMPRAKLAAMAAQAAELKQQQAARQAAKQEASKQLQEMLIEGARLASLLRQAVKQHYGIRAEKLAEFGLQPFRGRQQPGSATPTPATPSATPEVAATPHPDAPASR